MPAEEERGPAAARPDPSTGPAPGASPSPMEQELAGLGGIVSIMRNLTPEERWEVVDYLDATYGYRIDREAPAPVLDYTPSDTNELTGVVLRARRRGLEFGSLMMANIILDAGYRKTEEGGK
jgi:hypothetical protein